jgi:ABC-2 type transport system permease protein
VSELLRILRALFYLRATSFAGMVRSRLKRLRQPKYLFGAIVGVGYLYLVFFRRGAGPRPGARGEVPPELIQNGLEAIAEIAALGLVLVALVNWFVPRRPTLAFTEAEIAFLFPAPASRRMLIHYRVLSSQLAIVFTALVFTLVFRRVGPLDGSAVFRAVGWWITLATLNLHFTGTSFTLARLFNRSITTPARRVITLGVAAAVLIGIIAWGWSAFQLPSPEDLGTPEAMRTYVGAQLDAGPFPYLLAIPKLLIAPYFADGIGAFFIALMPALLVFAAHYFWVIHTEVSFEEASIARAEKRAARGRAAQQGDWRANGQTRKAQRPPFTLRSSGRPEVAFLWKNLLSAGAFFRPTGALVALAVVIGSSMALSHFPILRGAFVASSLALLGGTLLFGPLIARQDLRQDLRNADILKTYPLTGQQILLGELLTPITILSCLVWLGLLAVVLMVPARGTGFGTSWFGPAALGLAIVTPPFVAIQLLVPNAATILFPAWVQQVGNRAEHGIEAMGQRIIFVAGMALITVLAIVPAAIAGALLYLIGKLAGGVFVGGALAVPGVFAILSVEAWLGIRWLGSRFEDFDLSAELRP